jgi:hypothetical protein
MTRAPVMMASYRISVRGSRRKATAEPRNSRLRDHGCGMTHLSSAEGDTAGTQTKHRVAGLERRVVAEKR